jgi:Holliday junction DNA helicase RuvA
MIARIQGTLVRTTEKALLIETYGITYEVFVTAETLLKSSLGKEITLWTSHIIREDIQDLYGFENLEDQGLFELLLNVSGIGPRSALGVMNVATLGTIARAIHTNDVGYLTKISGIGKKTAEKIILELRDKLPQVAGDTIGKEHHDTLDALIALGYSESQAREVLREINPEHDTQTKIREALRILSERH